MSSVFPAIAVIERSSLTEREEKVMEKDGGKRDGPCSSFAVSIPRKLKVDCTSGPAGSYEKALVKTSLIPLSSTPSLLAPVRGLRLLSPASLYLRFAHSISITTDFIATNVGALARDCSFRHYDGLALIIMNKRGCLLSFTPMRSNRGNHSG